MFKRKPPRNGTAVTDARSTSPPAVVFIVGLKQLDGPRTARRGNRIAALGMLLAVVVTLGRPRTSSTGAPSSPAWSSAPASAPGSRSGSR